MASFQTTGVIIHIGEPEQITEKFSKQLVVVEVENGEYPEQYPIEFHNAKIGEVANFAEGQEVTIHFNIRGREWVGHGKWFTTLAAWKIEGATATAPPAKAYVPPAKAKTFTPPAPVKTYVAKQEIGTEDDLPF